MAVANLNILSFPKFDMDDQNTFALRWDKYKKRYENLCIAMNIRDNVQKLALLLNYGGEEFYDVYERLVATGEEIPEGENVYTRAIRLLDEHFNPRSNTTYEIYLFRHLKQLEDEPLHTLFIRLKQQAAKCNFGGNLDIEIKQQIILSTTRNKLRRYAFTNPEITLQQILTHGKNLEDITKQSEEIAQDERLARSKQNNKDKL